MKLRPLLCFLALAGVTGTSFSRAAEEVATATLEKFTVKGQAINSFGFDIHTYVDGDKKIRFMLIGEISESGAAFGRDLEPGDEIVKINGRAVRDFDRLVAPQTDLGKLLLNRRPGDTIDLEIVKHRRAKVTLRIDTAIRVETVFPTR